MQGGEKDTTNNRMELTAAIMALSALKWPCQVVLYSDSAYLINAFSQGWITRWQMNGWRTVKKEPVENRDLWQQLLDLTETHEVSWQKVKGHADDRFNTICDAMAVEESQKAAKFTEEIKFSE